MNASSILPHNNQADVQCPPGPLQWPTVLFYCWVSSVQFSSVNDQLLDIKTLEYLVQNTEIFLTVNQAVIGPEGIGHLLGCCELLMTRLS